MKHNAEILQGDCILFNKTIVIKVQAQIYVKKLLIRFKNISYFRVLIGHDPCFFHSGFSLALRDMSFLFKQGCHIMDESMFNMDYSLSV